MKKEDGEGRRKERGERMLEGGGRKEERGGRRVRE